MLTFLNVNNETKRLFLNGIEYWVNISLDTSQPIDSFNLTSSDGYILTDSNGLYLTFKGDE